MERAKYVDGVDRPELPEAFWKLPERVPRAPPRNKCGNKWGNKWRKKWGDLHFKVGQSWEI